MKKRLLSFATAALSAFTATAQPMMVYEAGATQGTYTPESGLKDIAFAGTEINGLVFAANDAEAQGGVYTKGYPIGFDFKYNNRMMNQVLVAANGYIILGQDSAMVANPGNYYFIFSSNDQADAAGIVYRANFAAINDGTLKTSISHGITGTAPNREFVVQYSNIQLGLDNWGEFIPRDTVSMQIRLHETTGKIEFVTFGFEPCKATVDQLNWNDMFKIGILGTNKDMLTKSGSFTDNIFNTNENSINWGADAYPTDGLHYWFLPPADCDAPATGVSNLKAATTSLAASGEFTATEAADHYLVLVSEQAELSKLPEDGVFYATDDSVGAARVLAYSTESTFASEDILKEATPYYIYVVATNSLCMFGPKYNTANIEMAPVSTCPPAPTAFSVINSDSTSATLSASANTAGNDVLIAYTTEPKMNQWSQVIAGGTFGQPAGNYAPGDAIDGGGIVVYTGKATDNAEMTDLQTGTVYHLAAWSRGADGRYSSTMLETDVMTLPKVPWNVSFDNQAVPSGWTSVDDSRWGLAMNNTLQCRYGDKDATNGITTWIETPYVYLSEYANRLVYNLNMSEYAGHVNGGYTFNDRDTIRLQVSTDGVTYTTFKEYTKSNAPVFSKADTWVKMFEPFYEAAGSKAKIRIWMKLYGAPTLVFSDIRIEHKGSCDYPVNVNVDNATIIADRAAIDWTPQGEEDAWDIRYRKYTDGQPDDWCEPFTVRTRPYLISGLEGAATYDIQVRARCSIESCSDWSETATFCSGLAVPFNFAFADYTELSDEWKFAYGELTESTSINIETAEEGGGWEFYVPRWGSTPPSMLHMSRGEVANDWLVTPLINLGDGSINHLADLVITNTYSPDEPSDIEYKVVVAKDGKTFTANDVVLTFSKADLPAQNESKHFTAPLKNLKGDVRLGIFITGQNAGAPDITLDNLSVSYSCVNDVAAKADFISEDSLHVSWTSAADEWLVAFYKDSEPRPQYTTVSKPEFGIGRLERHTNYILAITKSCEPGDTAKAVVMEIMTQGDACAMPEDPKATAKKYSALLEWTADAAAYNVRYRAAGTATYLQEQTSATSFNLTGLTDGKEYEFCVQAMCSKAANDTSAYTPWIKFATLPETCAKPTNITITPQYNKATVTWLGEADKYELNYRKDSDTEWISTIANGLTAEISNLTAKTSYQLRMRSICAEGDSSLWTTPQTFVTTAEPECVTPTGLTVANLTDHSALLSWTADASNLSWNLRYRPSNITAWTETESLSNTSYQLSGLTANTLYIWTVKAACEENRTSNWAAQNRFTTPQASGIDAIGLTGVRVFANGKVINVENPAGGLIKTVCVYHADGKLIGKFDVNTCDNIFIPMSANGLKIVKVYGAKHTKTARVTTK